MNFLLMYDYFSKYPYEEKLESMKVSLGTEMPKTSKYLLIAAYIASFVSPKNDKRLFCIKSSKQKKKIQVSNGNRTDSKIVSLVGPKQFTLNRLLSIFSALSGQRNWLTTSILQQVGVLFIYSLYIYCLFFGILIHS